MSGGDALVLGLDGRVCSILKIIVVPPYPSGSCSIHFCRNGSDEPTMDEEKRTSDCDHVETALEPQTLPNPGRERRLVRKLDRTILPWIMLLYLLSYLDR
jgi:hypothetical protein